VVHSTNSGASKQAPINGDGEVVQTAPLPQVAERPDPAPVVQAPAPQPAAAAPSNKDDALDALIRQSGTK
jgi:hypothetical protein